MRSSAPRIALVAALTAALGLGCGGKKTRPALARDAGADATTGPTIRDLTPRTSGTGFDEPATPMPRELRAALLEPGAAPRAVRRYHPVAEARELRLALSITTTAYRQGAWVGPTKLPVITEGFGVTTEATPTAAPPTIALRGLVGEIGDGAAAGRADADAYLSRWRGLLERRRVTVAIDARGGLGPITLHDDPAGTTSAAATAAATDELVQRWLGLAVPLPAEAIGVGARWKVVTLLRAGGAVVKQTATYRLTAVDGDTWTIASELERVAEQQRIEIPSLPATITAELIALRRVVTGTLTVTAASPLPRAGRLTSESSAHARFTADDQQVIDEVSDDTATIVVESR